MQRADLLVKSSQERGPDHDRGHTIPSGFQHIQCNGPSQVSFQFEGTKLVDQQHVTRGGTPQDLGAPIQAFAMELPFADYLSPR
jgi:hypothetical protein